MVGWKIDLQCKKRRGLRGDAYVSESVWIDTFNKMLCEMCEWQTKTFLKTLSMWKASDRTQLELLPCGCMPPPTSQVGVYIHICLVSYSI